MLNLFYREWAKSTPFYNFFIIFFRKLIISDCEIIVRVRNLRHSTTGEVVHEFDGVKSGILFLKYINKIFFLEMFVDMPKEKDVGTFAKNFCLSTNFSFRRCVKLYNKYIK